MKPLFFTALLLISCNHKETATVQPQSDSTAVEVPAAAEDKLTIEPGNRIGQIALEQNAESLTTLLGVPDLQDAAMGKAWQTWYGISKDTVGKTQLNIFTNYKDNELREKVVRLVRVTSTDFRTADKIGAGSLISDIRKRFPEVEAVASYPDPPHAEVLLYDDREGGIAFEIADSVATSVIIHRKGFDIIDEYSTFHPEMKRR